MRTLLICHEGAPLDQIGLARWLSSFSELTGIVVIQERAGRKWQRIRREIKRAGILRFGDALAFRLYYQLFLARRDRLWKQQKVEELSNIYPPVKENTPVLYTPSPNNANSEQFVRQARPDLVLARCKTILKQEIFSIPSRGTLVMHPGICPEYRNAHGCFWALANDDLQKVGMTLLAVDKGVDTGPVYGYYSYPFDEVRESHFVIQNRVVHENLDALQNKLHEIYEGTAVALDTSGRPSATWGQPWLSRYARWKLKARKRNAPHAVSLVYHDVVSDGRFDSSGFLGIGADRYKLDANEFDKHLEAIIAAKATPGSVLQYLRSRKQGRPLFLTFDDGGASAFEEIAGQLEKRGWVGHFFVTTDCIGSPGFLTREQIRALRARGHVIGSHSCTHPLRMASCSQEELLREWVESSNELSKILEERVTVASVPGGYFSRKVAEAASEAGIEALFTSEPVTHYYKVRKCLVLGRFSIIRGIPPTAVALLVSDKVFPQLTQKLRWNLKKMAKAAGGRHYLRVREQILKRYP